MIVGIDLGTSTSEVAYVDENGNIVVVPNSENEAVIPSVVHIKLNGKAIVGSEAREYLFTRPECTFMEVKRKFGSDEKLIAHGKVYSPEEIQSCIIEYLVGCVEEYTRKSVTGAVITVPAYFTDIQRKQTIKAGGLAGIDVKRVINEPTAAALDYGLQNMSECEYILVYDFGGGTLDVTVLELFEGVIDVKSSCGNNRLGGKDFDEALMKHIGGRHYSTLMEDPRAAMKLKQAANDCKTALSSEDSVQVRIPLIADGVSIDRAVMRAEFEELIGHLVESTGEQIDTALDDAGLKPSDLHRVILVGGSTRIPSVRKFVEEKIGLKSIQYQGMDTGVDPDLMVEQGANISFNPDLMVVRGAAVQAAIIEGVIEQEQSVVLSDVCPFSLGVKVLTTDGFNVDKLINRNVTIPYEYSKMYTATYEYQEHVLIEIYQGEFTNPYENTFIGQVDLDKLPQRRNELAAVEVTFSYDVNGLLSVKARSPGNDNTAGTVIDINKGNLPASQPVKLDGWLKADGASKYRPLLRKAKKLYEKYTGSVEYIDGQFFVIHDMCDSLKAALLLGNKERAEKKANEIREMLEMLD